MLLSDDQKLTPEIKSIVRVHLEKVAGKLDRVALSHLESSPRIVRGQKTE